MAFVNEYAVEQPVKIPAPKTVMIDLVEFWCYSVLLEAPPDEIFRRTQEWERILSQHEDELKVQEYGRLRNRIRMAALVGEFCSREAMSSAETSLINQKSSYWEWLMDGLESLRGKFLRFDRDAKQGDEENDNQDEDLAYLPMFDEAYNELLSMIKLQHALTTLREQLQEETKKPAPTNGAAQRRMSQIIGKYEGSVRKECASDNHVLLRFLRRDLLKAHKKGETKALPKHIIADLRKVMEKDDASISLRLIQRKTQVLLRDWADQNLAPPTLVRLGYCGLTTTSATQHDQQTVSSWGTYNDEDAKQEREKFINSEPLDVRKEADPEVLRQAAKAAAESDFSEDYLTPDEEEPSVSSLVKDVAIGGNRTTTGLAGTENLSTYAVSAHEPHNTSNNDPQTKHKTAMKEPAMTPPPKFVNVIAMDLVEQFNGHRLNDIAGSGDGIQYKAGVASRKRKKMAEPLSGGGDADRKASRHKKQPFGGTPSPNRTDGFEGVHEEGLLRTPPPTIRHDVARGLSLRIRSTSTRRKKVAIQPRAARAEDPDNGVGASPGALNGEREWTTEEESAVRKGIREHGTDWDSIRDEYSSVLGTRGRTSLRRKYLEMKIRGDLNV